LPNKRRRSMDTPPLVGFSKKEKESASLLAKVREHPLVCNLAAVTLCLLWNSLRGRVLRLLMTAGVVYLFRFGVKVDGHGLSRRLDGWITETDT
jgi:hypothetical protein